MKKTDLKIGDILEIYHTDHKVEALVLTRSIYRGAFDFIILSIISGSEEFEADYYIRPEHFTINKYLGHRETDYEYAERKYPEYFL